MDVQNWCQEQIRPLPIYNYIKFWIRSVFLTFNYRFGDLFKSIIAALGEGNKGIFSIILPKNIKSIHADIFMPQPLIECVPNFSEARRNEVVDAITEAIGSVSGVRILDQHSDLDHNRTVITFVGSPPEVEEAVFRGIARAAELIDLNQHSGEHPRIGYFR